MIRLFCWSDEKAKISCHGLEIAALGRNLANKRQASLARSDRAGVWKLLRPESIGVTLTEGMMMEPGTSTSALVFHHPACANFSVSDEAAGRAPARPAEEEAVTGD
ncbi:MAG: vitamin B12 dependent-methionine synthase activation domain-containing protein [Terriglobales bacterium]